MATENRSAGPRSIPEAWPAIPLPKDLLSANLPGADGAAAVEAAEATAEASFSVACAIPEALFAALLRLYSKACRMRAPTSPPLDVGMAFELRPSGAALLSCSLPIRGQVTRADE